AWGWPGPQKRAASALAKQLRQPGETSEQPRVGFHVLSVHPIFVLAPMLVPFTRHEVEVEPRRLDDVGRLRRDAQCRAEHGLRGLEDVAESTNALSLGLVEASAREDQAQLGIQSSLRLLLLGLDLAPVPHPLGLWHLAPVGILLGGVAHERGTGKRMSSSFAPGAMTLTRSTVVAGAPRRSR